MPLAHETAVKNGKKGGRPPGRKNDATLEKETVLKAVQQRIMQSADRLLDYQMALARGLTYLFKIEKEAIRNKKGKITSYRAKKPEVVTDVNEIRDYLSGLLDSGDMHDEYDRNSTYYYITAKDPDKQSIDSLLDRGLGRPTQAVDLDIKSDGEKLQLFDESQILRIASRISNAHKPGKK